MVKKCYWCGNDAMEQPEPFFIQGRVFCSQSEFAQYVDKFVPKTIKWIKNDRQRVS